MVFVRDPVQKQEKKSSTKEEIRAVKN